jgi:hypothetical protein
MAFFDFIELRYEELTNQINSYLRSVYSRSNETFSNASPFGQVINVLKEFFQWSTIYQKNIVRNFQVEEADNNKALRNLSRIGGHNPTRSITATGTLKLKIKPGIDINSDISGGLIKVQDKTLLKNKTNGFNYTIRLGKDEEVFRLSQSSSIFLNVVQGTYEEQTFTGNGEINQSFSVNVSTTADVDNFDVEVLYNNNPLSIKDSQYDMLRNELACFTRTGMNGGLDVYFGNGDFGFIPEPGSIINVRYLLTEGTNGQILTPVRNDFQFLTEIRDGNDDTVDVTNNFDILTDKEITFASNGETDEFIKNILPNVSRNFVLATPGQYIYNLRRLELFSKVNVYNTLNDNKIFLFLIPKISNYYTGGLNYFNVPMDAFFLDDEEIDKTLTYLKKLGSITTNTVIEIIQPRISKYVMNIYIRKYEGYADDTIKQNVLSATSNYLTTLERDDRIVRSDMIKIIEEIPGVDSTQITFFSKKNEDYHKIKPDSDVIYGLDPVLGDIIVEKDELAIIRGGWSDRNYTYYNETPDAGGLGPLNIVFVGVTKKETNN